MNLKQLTKTLFLSLFIFTTFNQSEAQTIDKNIFFGINYWLYHQNSTTGVITETFSDYEKDLASAKLGLYRVGGIYANDNKKSLNDRDWYVNAITKIKAIGGEPLVQLPIDLTSSEVVSWYNYFNITKGLNVKYFAIGNEPDPTGKDANGIDKCSLWYNGSYYHHGRNYTGFRGQFRMIATKLKQIAPNSVIVGPSFALFYGDLQSTENNPFNTYFKDFIGDIGNDHVVTNNGTTKPILDMFAFNFYGYKTESDLSKRFSDIKTLIDNVNTQRNSALSFGITETNCKMDAAAPVRPWDYKAGQFVSLMMKQTMAYGGAFVTPWSIYESEGNKTIGLPDYSYYNSDGSRRSTMHHLNLLSSNARGSYMAAVQNAENDNIVVIGMKDANGYTVMLMNTLNSTPISYNATLNNVYSSNSATVKIKFNGNSSLSTEMSGTIAPKSTIVYTLNAAGSKLSKFTYTDGDIEPTEHILTNTFHGYYFHAVNVLSNDYMRPFNASNSGKIIQQYSSSTPSVNSYEWMFIASGNGYYNIKNKSTGMLIRPVNYSTDQNVELEQLADNSTHRSLASAQWKLESDGEGKFWIRNKNSGLYIRPIDGSKSDGAPIVQNILNSDFQSFKWSLNRRSSTARFAEDESPMGNELMVYPNFASDKFKLNLNRDEETNIEVSIFNSKDGMTVQHNSMKISPFTHPEINIENLPAGVYFVKVNANGQEKVMRMIKN